MSCNFHVGQKVVAIESGRYAPQGVIMLDSPIAPEVGKIYTVREIMLSVLTGVPCLKLHEIPDQTIRILLHGESRFGSLVFYAAGFRPVVTRKTDISIFTAMLTGKRVEVEA